jgi:hypothetical protein
MSAHHHPKRHSGGAWVVMDKNSQLPSFKMSSNGEVNGGNACGMFRGSSVAIEFFSPPPLFSLLGLGIRVEA